MADENLADAAPKGPALTETDDGVYLSLQVSRSDAELLAKCQGPSAIPMASFHPLKAAARGALRDIERKELVASVIESKPSLGRNAVTDVLTELGRLGYAVTKTGGAR